MKGGFAVTGEAGFELLHYTGWPQNSTTILTGVVFSLAEKFSWSHFATN